MQIKEKKEKKNRERIQAMNIDNKGTIRLMNDQCFNYE